MEMKAGGDSGGGFVRADQIDLKRLDEQLEKHLSKAWTLEKTKNKEEAEAEATAAQVAVTSSNEQQQLQQQQPQRVSGNGSRQEWEIDASKLVIKSVIARGTFGTVHRGIYDGLDVAVKLLDWGEEGQRTDAEIASLRAAFTQEVAVWHKLDHPNVTKFIGAKVGSSGLQIQTENGQIAMPRNICCVIVEYLPGGALKNYLIKNRRRKLAFKVVMQLALDLARGLSYLHSQKIVHRDVKTENMLLDKSRTLKIADFGVARVEASNPSDMTGETGTLGYMAPEVLNGNPYNRKCDVYSFAICLWEIYCCDMPYPNLSFSEMTTAVVRQNLRPEIPRCCPSSFANVMKKCWDVNPDKRPEMDEAVALLEAIDTSKGGGRAFQQGFLNQEGSSSSSSSSTCGLSVEELKRIPWFDYKEEEKGEISGVDCAVCLESFKAGDKCRLLPSCHHCFHLQCVDLWLMKMPFCPICRANARPMKKSMVADELA